MNLNANDLPLFATVAELKGITAAANKLGLPKSTVSNAIKRLESALEIRLLERNSRQLRLTTEGELFYKHCQQVNEQLELTKAAMSGLQAEPQGKLVVSLTMAFSRTVLQGAFAEFLRRYPQIELDIRISNDYEIDVISDPVDIAIKVGALPDSELVVTRLMSVPLYWVVSPQYLQQQGEEKVLSELAEHIQVIDKRYTRLNLMMRNAGQKQGIKLPNCSVSNEPLMVRDMVVAGAGVGLIPAAFCQDALATGTLIRLVEQWQVEPVSEISLVYPSRRFISPKTRVFIDFMKEICADKFSL